MSLALFNFLSTMADLGIIKTFKLVKGSKQGNEN